MPEGDDIIGVAQGYAKDILSGVISPYEGGRRIWWECHLKLKQGDHRLDPFVYWASEYEDTEEEDRRDLCNRAIKEAASLLIESGSAL